MDNLLDTKSDQTKEILDDNKSDNELNRGINTDKNYKVTPNEDFEDATDTSGTDKDKTGVDKKEVVIAGSLSGVFTNALLAVLNKTDGVNEYQLVENKDNLKEVAKKDEKKGSLSKESQSQDMSQLATVQYLTNDKNYYKALDDESIDPDYYYNYIGKNTDINNSEDVIKTINRILNGYNKKYLDNNQVVLENNGPLTKHVIDLESWLESLSIPVKIVTREKIITNLKY